MCEVDINKLTYLGLHRNFGLEKKKEKSIQKYVEKRLCHMRILWAVLTHFKSPLRGVMGITIFIYTYTPILTLYEEPKEFQLGCSETHEL